MEASGAVYTQGTEEDSVDADVVKSALEAVAEEMVVIVAGDAGE